MQVRTQTFWDNLVIMTTSESIRAIVSELERNPLPPGLARTLAYRLLMRSGKSDGLTQEAISEYETGFMNKGQLASLDKRLLASSRATGEGDALHRIARCLLPTDSPLTGYEFEYYLEWGNSIGLPYNTIIAEFHNLRTQLK